MPQGWPAAPSVQTVTDKFAAISPTKGNVAGLYVWLVDPDATDESLGLQTVAPGPGVYGPSSVTDSGGNWSIPSVPAGTYVTFWGARSDRWESRGKSPYLVALNPVLAITFLTPSGADDRTQLNNALANLPATGGKILMGSGAWQIGSVGNVSYQMLSGQHVMLEGQGKVSIASTVPEPGTEYGALTLIGAADGTSEVTLRNFALNHTNSGTGLVDGIMIRYPGWPTAPTNRAVKRFTIEDVAVTGASRAGLRLMYTQNGRLVNVSSTGNRMAGVFLLGDDGVTDIGGTYSNNVSGSLGSDYGISCDSSASVPFATNLLYINTKADNNGRKGYDVHHGHNIRMYGVSAKGNGYCGIYAVAEGLDKDTGDITIIGGDIDMAGANASAGATLAIQLGGSGALNAAQDLGTFTVIGIKIKNGDSTNNSANSAIYISTPSSGPAVKKVVISDVTVENAGANPCRFVTSENSGVAIGYVSITDCIVHLALLASTSPAVWLQQVTTVKIADNEIQVDASAGGGWGYLTLPAGVQGDVSDNQLNGAVPTSYISSGSATLRQLGNSANGSPLNDMVGFFTFDTKGHSLATKVGLPTLTAVNANVANAVVTGNDEGFTVTFDLTGAPGANVNLFTVNFANAYGVRPTIGLTNSSSLATGNNWYVVSPLAGAFTVRNAAALGIAVGYAFDGIVKGRTS